MDTVITRALQAACAACAAVALLGYARMARTKDGIRDAGCWHAPLLLTSAAIALATALGALRPLPGAALAALPALVVGVIAQGAWRAAARPLGKGEATRIVAKGLGSRLRESAWNAREDLRDLRGLLRRDPPPAEAAPGGPVPFQATAPGVPPWKRTVPGVPPITADPALGAVPAPSEVSAALAASGVGVPPAWAAVASEAADHEPETDDEHLEHMDGEVAGILTWAEGAMSRAETLGDVVGLDPAYIAAQYELADAIADLAAYAAQALRRYHDHYDDLREAADGRPLPANRFWFGDAGGAPQPGQAA
jgi:hypothetical protein